MKQLLFVAMLLGCGERVVYVTAPAPAPPVAARPVPESRPADPPPRSGVQGTAETDSWWCTTTRVIDQDMETTLDACYRGSAACDRYRATSNAADPALRYGPCVDYPAVACFRFANANGTAPWCWTNMRRCRAALRRIAMATGTSIVSDCTVME